MSHHQTSLFLAHLLVLWIKVDRVASVIHNTVRGRVGWTKKKIQQNSEKFPSQSLLLPVFTRRFAQYLPCFRRNSGDFCTVIFSLRSQIAENRVGRHTDDQTADMSTWLLYIRDIRWIKGLAVTSSLGESTRLDFTSAISFEINIFLGDFRNRD